MMLSDKKETLLRHFHKSNLLIYSSMYNASPSLDRVYPSTYSKTLPLHKFKITSKTLKSSSQYRSPSC